MSSTELEQLLQAIKREPGSRAFALLAERYVEAGELDKAREVCRAGFDVNPAYERGAVVFLDVLRRLKEIGQASEVYGRAIAEHPRSSDLRLAWARILRQAGRDYEARLRAKEAADLAPESKEARALLATLAATPPPARRKTGGIATRPPLAAGSIREKVAALRPRSGGAMHGRFDFTPTPAYVEPPAGVDAEAFDARAEFFDISDQPGRVQIDVAAPPAPPPPPPVVGPIDPTLTSSQNLFPGLRPATDAAPPPASQAEDQGVSTAEGAATLETPLAAPPTPLLPTLPPPQDASSPAAAAEQSAPPPPLAPAAGSRSASRRRWWLVPLATMLIALPVAGALLYRFAKERAFRNELSVALASARADRLQGWLDGRARACSAAETRPRSAAAQVSCALLTAHLATRFSRDALSEPLTTALQRAERLAPKHPWIVVGRLLQRANALQPADVPAWLQRLPGGADDWHVTFARARLHLVAGKPRAALDEITALDDKSSAAALLHLGVRVARLTGARERRDALLARGLRLFPRHPGLLMEQAFVERKASPVGSLDAEVLKEAETVPWLQADLELLRAHRAASAGDYGKAARFAIRAAKVAPRSRPEAAWYATIWRWDAALADSTTTAARARQLYPVVGGLLRGAAVDFARVLLALQRSEEADRLLRQLPSAALPPDVRRQSRQLRARACAGRGDTKTLTVLCQPQGADEELLAACAESRFLLGRSKALRATLAAGSLGAANKTLLSALVALSAGDAEKATEILERLPPDWKSRPFPTLVAAWAAIGRYHLDAAIELLRTLVARDRGSVRSRLALAKAFVLRGNDAEARDLLESVDKARPTDPPILASMGEAWIALGNLDRAAAFTVPRIASPAESHALELLAARVAAAKGQFRTAQKLLGRLLKLTPDDPSVQLELGQIALRRGRQRQASQYFARALKARPRDPALRLSLAVAYARAGKYAQVLPHVKYAVDFFDRAGQRGRAMDALVSVGKILAKGRQAGRKLAIELLFQASTRSDAPPDALYQLGLVYKANDDEARAIWCFEQVLRKAPEMALAYLELGLVQIQHRKWRRAGRKALKRYLELAPTGPKARKVRAILARRR